MTNVTKPKPKADTQSLKPIHSDISLHILRCKFTHLTNGEPQEKPPFWLPSTKHRTWL